MWITPRGPQLSRNLSLRAAGPEDGFSLTRPEELPLLPKRLPPRLRALRAVVIALLLASACFADGAKIAFQRRDLVFQNYIDDADLSPDGTRFAVALEEKAGEDVHISRLELWNFSAGRLADKSFPVAWRGLPQVCLRFSGDGRFLIFYDGQSVLHVLDEHLSEVRRFDIGLASEDVQKLSTMGANALPGRIEPLPLRPHVVQEMAVAPAGSLVAVRFVVHELSQMIHIFDFQSGRQVRYWGQPILRSGSGRRMAWDPSGERLALGFSSEIVHERQRADVLVYDVPTGAIVHFLPSSFGGVASLAFAGNDHLIVASSRSIVGVPPELRRINLAGNREQVFAVPQSGLSDPFVVTPDGKRLVALAVRTENPDRGLRPLDTRLVVWDLAGNQPRAVTPDLWPVKVPSIAISVDGRRVLAGRRYDSRRMVLLELK